MIELRDDQLVFRFPEVHSSAELSIDFQRTLRIPDDGTAHFLPPGLGQFPLHHVDDYRETTPAEWAAHGGVFFPMHQAEATWLSFDCDYPMAVKVGAGKINAVTGRQWRNKLAKLQDYLGGARTAVARRLQRPQGDDQAVRRHATRRGVHR